eukprot:31107-Pelagococcus_subviridis.AAC.9
MCRAINAAAIFHASSPSPAMGTIANASALPIVVPRDPIKNPYKTRPVAANTRLRVEGPYER